jgi:hypothetical protein
VIQAAILVSATGAGCDAASRSRMSTFLLPAEYLIMDLFMTFALIMAFVAGWLLCDSVLPWLYKR